MKRSFWSVGCLPLVLVITGCAGSSDTDVDGRSSSVTEISSEDRKASGEESSPEEDPASVGTYQLSDAVLIVNEESFDRHVVMSDKPVIVDFSAPWCVPCRLMDPEIDAVAQEYQGRAVVAKVDIDESARLAERFQIRAVPAIVVFQNGRVVEESIGLQTQKQLAEMIDRQLADTSVGSPATPKSVPPRSTETASAELLRPSPDSTVEVGTLPSVSGPSLPAPPSPK